MLGKEEKLKIVYVVESLGDRLLSYYYFYVMNCLKR